ncbi:MAG: ORF6N domain-containing protein [Nanoarchaeota archaeon]|nr:ORF6N domain-containing protein [Nanoarchaeota archaeon]MBU1855304.1 ORF6N domain-containing protein [Nanoarchaeota archaeon]
MLQKKDYDSIKKKIFTIREVQVMLDSDLAELYGVETKQLNKAVKRNIERFPQSFMFQLTNNEYADLQSQNVTLKQESDLRFQNGTLKKGRGQHRKYLPYAFTEQGVSMLSGVLKSHTAVKISIHIMNAFVAMRKFIASNTQIFHRLDRVELKQIEHDKKFENLFDAIESKNIKPSKGIFFCSLGTLLFWLLTSA